MEWIKDIAYGGASAIAKGFHTIMNTATFGGYNYLREATDGLFFGFTERQISAYEKLTNTNYPLPGENAVPTKIKTGPNAEFIQGMRDFSTTYFDIRNLYS